MKWRRVGVLLLLVLSACGGVAAPTASPAATPVAQATPSLITSPTVGATLTPQDPTATLRVTPSPTPLIADPQSGRPGLVRGQLQQRPFVVMLDNHPDAYPQTGLDEAVLVFEALAEYGVTRYMAVYAPELAPVQGSIGPVRSARLYFVQWAMGLNGVYVHAGGSPTGLERLTADANTLVVNLDALERDHESTFFWRDTSRFAPHNLYTNQELIEAYNEQRISPETLAADLSESGYEFALDALEDAATEASTFGYYFLYADDSVSWSYEPDLNRYWRFRRGRPHVDAVSGDQLWFKSVIVMEVFEAPIPGDPQARIDQQVIGEGQAAVFANGVQVSATWRKASEAAPLRFYAEDGSEIVLPPGPQWIAAIPGMNQLWVEP